MHKAKTRLRYSARNTYPFVMRVEEIVTWGSISHGWYAHVENRETGQAWRSDKLYPTRHEARSEGWAMLDRHVAEAERRAEAEKANRDAIWEELQRAPRDAVPKGFRVGREYDPVKGATHDKQASR